MESFKDLLTSQGRKIEIADDIEALEALATIREHWDQLREAVAAQDVEGVITFIETLIRDPDNGPLVKALNGLGLPGKKLREVLARLGDVFQRVDRKYLTLLKSVGEFDEDGEHPNVGLFEWPLIGLKKTGAASGTKKKPTYAFDLGASAKLELEAGDTWPGTATQVADPLLRIGLGGSFEFGAKARIPFSAGALGIGSEASRSAFLDYYFDARADGGLFASAVVRRLDSLPNPLSLDSVWKAFESSDIVGAVLETEGESAFSVEVSLADAFSFKHDVKTNVGLTFSAKVRRRSTFMLRLRKIVDSSDGSFMVEATIERLQAKSGERAVNLGVEIDLASLGQRLTKLINEQEHKLKEILEEYEQYLHPGTYLTKEALDTLRNEFIDDFFDDAKLKTALGDVAEHALGLGDATAGDGLKKLVEGKTAAVLDGADGVITGRIDEVAKKIGEALAEKLGFAPDLVDTVAGKVRSLVAGIRDDLDQRVKALSAKKLDKLIEHAGNAGVKVAAGGAKADKALSGVRNAIGLYETALAKVKAKVSDAAQMKLTAKLFAEKQSSLERAIDAKVMFLRPTESARKIYGDIVRGDFDALAALLREPTSDVAVDPETTLSEVKTTSRRVGFAAVLVGFNVGAAKLFDARSEVVVRGGRVSVLTEAEFRSIRDKRFEDREVSFVDAYELSAAQETREFDVALEISHEDEKLRRREVEKVIEAFESAALLPQGTTARALDTFDRWISVGEKNRIPADIKFALRLGSKQLERLIQLDRRTAAGLSVAAQRTVFHAVVNELVQAEAHTEDHVRRAAKAVHEMLGQAEPMSKPEEILFDYTLGLHDELKGTVDHVRRSRLEDALDLHLRSMTLVDAIDLMGDIYTAVPEIGDEHGWDAERYDAAQRELNDKLSKWLKAGWRDAARPRTIAFVGTLIALAKMDGESDAGFLTLTMTKRSGDPETVVLTPT